MPNYSLFPKIGRWFKKAAVLDETYVKLKHSVTDRLVLLLMQKKLSVSTGSVTANISFLILVKILKNVWDILLAHSTYDGACLEVVEGVSRDIGACGAGLPRSSYSSSSLRSSTRHASRPRSPVPPEWGGAGRGGGAARPLDRHGDRLAAGQEDHLRRTCSWWRCRRGVRTLKAASHYLPQVPHRHRHVHNVLCRI